MAAMYEREYYHPAGFAVRLVNILIGLIEAAFALRIILKLLAANPGSEFVAWVYAVTDRLLGPFAGALPVFVIGGNMALELSVILAMIGYSILGWLVIRMLYFVFLSPQLYVEHPEHPQMPLRG
ncbi:MAG: YggT family protein [bacterium]|nr:YggT family protein [bacterium]